jgi:hypothetical protein
MGLGESRTRANRRGFLRIAAATFSAVLITGIF